MNQDPNTPDALDQPQSASTDSQPAEWMLPRDGQSRRTFLRNAVISSAAAAAAVGAGAAVAATPIGPRLLSRIEAARASSSPGGCTAPVTNGNDSGAGSLRQALADASPGDIITFCPDVTLITLYSAIVIEKDVTISGPGADRLTISGNNVTQAFMLIIGVTVALSGVTVTKGGVPRNVGAIVNSGTLTLSDCTVADNAAANGSGIYNTGALSITRCAFLNNTATNVGGAIYNQGTLSLTDSTIAGNTNLGDTGGGIWNLGTLTITSSTISGNSAAKGGGGIYNWGPLVATNSTISGNTTPASGGGIWNVSTATLTSCTIACNQAGGVGNNLFNTADPINLHASMVARSAGGAAPDIAGTVFSVGYNLIQNTSGAVLSGPATADIYGLDPAIAPLANNGGPTQTHALLPGSSCMNQISPPQCPVIIDQRGVSRPQGTACDIGSYEA